MKINPIIRNVTTAFLLLSLTSCSCFASRTQPVKIVANDPAARLYVDGEYVGKGVAVKKLKRNKSYVITANSGNRQGVAVVDSGLSTTGMLDIIGGVMFIIPFIGLAFPGAYSIEQDTVPVHVH